MSAGRADMLVMRRTWQPVPFTGKVDAGAGFRAGVSFSLRVQGWAAVCFAFCVLPGGRHDR